MKRKAKIYGQDYNLQSQEKLSSNSYSTHKHEVTKHIAHNLGEKIVMDFMQEIPDKELGGSRLRAEVVVMDRTLFTDMMRILKSTGGYDKSRKLIAEIENSIQNPG